MQLLPEIWKVSLLIAPDVYTTNKDVEHVSHFMRVNVEVRDT